MGLLLLKDRDGRYRRTWYAIVNVNGKRTSRVLKTPLHGKIPLDENGNFSLALTGDEKFEASKAAARQELMTKNSDRRQSQVTSRRHAEDLASVEDLTGAKIRKGNMCTSPQRLTTLLKETRAARAQGVRSACLYGWHSCRMYFVVTARRTGIDPETLKKITGHATVRMVEHYNNADTVEAANTMRRQMSAKHRKPAKSTSSDLASAIQAILASTDLTPETRNAAILALTAKTT